MNLVRLFKKFPTQESCIEYLEKIRFAKGYYCLYCGSTKIYTHRAEKRYRLQCGDCCKSFKVTVGTIFHDTRIDLRKWFWLISMMLNAKKGISACQVARELEMRRPTVWAIMHKIRAAMNTEQKELLTGIFEMDETFIKVQKDDNDDEDDTKGGFGRSTKNNAAVVAIKQKGGNIKAFATQNTKYHTLAEIAMTTAKHGSEIHTDEYSGYNKFDLYYKHKKVNHSKEYVSSEGTHCNSVEGFWSLLKRGVKGQFHHISQKYLQNYITEFEYRYNVRDLDESFVFGEVVGKMLCIK